MTLVRDERPLQFFSSAAIALALASVVLAIPVVRDFVATGLVPRLPTAVLATGLMGLAFLSSACGLILDSVARGRKEAKRMAYLRVSGGRDHAWPSL